MLIRLTPSQIEKYSDLIIDAVEKSMPPYTYSSYMKSNEVLRALLADNMQCWIIHNESVGIAGIAVTAIMPDFYTHTRNLLIYSLYGIKPIEPNEWIESLKTLKKFAKAKGCYRIIAYTDMPNVISLVRKLGGDTSITFISIEVGDEKENL
jgi:hypothetical protein